MGLLEVSACHCSQPRQKAVCIIMGCHLISSRGLHTLTCLCVGIILCMLECKFLGTKAKELDDRKTERQRIDRKRPSAW